MMNDDKELANEIIRNLEVHEGGKKSKIEKPVFDSDLSYRITGEDVPKRALKNWLHSYLAVTQNQESPDIFHFWCGMSAIAAAMNRRVWFDQGFYKTYPNLYVLLIAKSAECAKSTAVRWADQIISSVPNLVIMRDKMTPEGLLSKLSVQISEEALAYEGKVKKEGCAYIIARELRVLFSQVSYISGLTETLCDLYDCPDTHPYTTRHNPIEIHNACINILGASTPEWLANGLPSHDKSGGFLGRFIFAVADKPKRKIAWPEMSDKAIALREALMYDLQHIAKLRGPVTATEEAKSLYEDWYMDFKIPEDPRMTEYYGRKKTTILKIASILSISSSNDMIVKPIHIKTALKVLDNVEHDMTDAFTFLGATAESILCRQILSLLQQRGVMSRVNLLRSISYKLRTYKDLDNAISMLLQEEKITRELANTGKDEDKNDDGSPKQLYRLTTAEERRQSAARRAKKAKILEYVFDKDGEWLGD